MEGTYRGALYLEEQLTIILTLDFDVEVHTLSFLLGLRVGLEDLAISNLVDRIARILRVASLSLVVGH